MARLAREISPDAVAEAVAMLNATARSTTRKSPKKRAHSQVYTPDSPSKRRRIEDAGDTIEVRPRLQGLKRKSQAATTPRPPKTSRKDVYELPEDGEYQEEQHESEIQKQPAKVQRTLKKLSKAVGVNTDALRQLSAKHGLADSPAKRTRSRIAIADLKDLTKTTDGISPRKKGRPRKQATTSVEAQLESSVAIPTTLERRIPSNAAPQEKGKYKDPSAASSSRREAEGPVKHRSPGIALAKRRQEARDRAADHDADGAVEGQAASPVAPEDCDEAAESEVETETEPQPAQRMASDRREEMQSSQNPKGSSMAQQTDEDDKIEALKEFEQEAKVYDCRDHWTKMLIAARQNRKTVLNAKSEAVQALIKSVDRLRDMYDILRDSSEAEKEKLEDSICSKADRIQGRVNLLSRSEQPRESTNIIRDIYTSGIPSMVFLLQSIVKARYSEGSLDSDSLAEIIWTMDIAHKLCYKAFHWQPRPSTLDSGVLGDTKNAITVGIARIRQAYERAKNDIDRPSLQQRKLEVLEERRKKLNEELERKDLEREQRREDRRRVAAKWEAERRSWSRLSSQPIRNGVNNTHRRRMEEIVDIDDIETEDGTTTPIANGNAQLSNTAHGKLPERPRPVRQETEDIPGPSQGTPRWTPDEITALSEGLQTYREADRFERILDTYADVLGGRDMDELMQQAQFFKQSMASQIEAGRVSGDWAWLQSVPG